MGFGDGHDMIGYAFVVRHWTGNAVLRKDLGFF